ncbi:MAG: hypothetical protein F4Z17_03455 [Acidimicrobiia bacterium]|nr:hypothetical protein [Acidimicrobiia bacterium]
MAHIEMKAPGKNLNQYVKQALGYAFDEGVHICALTTGLEWKLYLPREAVPSDQRLFTTLRLEHDPVDQLAEDLETFLGKENLLSGRSERRAKEVLKARRQARHLNTKLPEIWQRMVKGPDGKLVELFIERAYEELNLRPTAEQVQAVLRGSKVPTVTPTKPAAARGGNGEDLPGGGSQRGVPDLERRILDRFEAWNSGQDRSRENSSRLNSLLHSWLELAEEDRQTTVNQMAAAVGKTPTTLRYRASRSDEARAGTEGEVTNLRRRVVAYRLWGQRYRVNTWAAMLVGVAEALYQRHGASFDQILTFQGRTRMYASRNREDISYNPKLVGTSGIYIETHGNVADKKRRAGQFLQLFGHSPDDLQIEARTE